MTFDRRRLMLAVPLMLAMTGAPALAADANTVIITTKDGKITVELEPNLAPKTVAQIKTLTNQHFYDGIVFHRVIDGFMAQTGDPTGTGTGGSKLPDLKAEFTATPFKRGTLGMARAQSPDSANSQFFICLADAPFLDGKYTVFGHVTAGMDAVDKIKKGASDDNGMVTAPDKIITMRMADGK
jgi:peptidylprolyl isomerase